MRKDFIVTSESVTEGHPNKLCDQTPALMPLPIWLAHKLARRLMSVRVQKLSAYLTPDGKTQVGVEYCDRRPYRIHSITVIASQSRQPSAGEPNRQQLQDDLREAIIGDDFQEEDIKPDGDTYIFINPDGLFIGV